MTIKKIQFISIILLSGISICPAQNNDSLYYNALASISKNYIEKNLKVLGDDSLAGRGNGAEGGNGAAKFIANEYSQLGLKPGEGDTGYFQYIPMHGSYALPDSKLNIYYDDSRNDSLKLFNDYVMYKSGEQTFIPSPMELVFVGYGIIAPEYDYNDYQSVDVEGKVVVYLEGEPESKSRYYFEGEKGTIYSSPVAKQRLAISRGAVGCIMIPNIKDKSNLNWKKTVQDFSFEDVTLAYSVSGNFSILINPNAAGKLFVGSGYSLDDVYRMTKKQTVTSFPLKTKITFKGKFKERDFLSPNVIGMIPGNDTELKNTCLIISAHYDHLGIGPEVKGDTIYNGVLDNASGVAGMLELARAFSSSKIKNKRTIIFMAVTGEEKGLLGSTYYTDHPVFPLYKTIADINIDGLAVYDEFKSVIGVGSDLSTLGDLFVDAARNQGVSVADIPPGFEQSESFYRSDQVAFAKAGIPSLLILDAPDYVHLTKEEALAKIINYDRRIYHTPFDDLSQPINYSAAVQHVKILFALCYNLVNSEDVPEWKRGVSYLNIRLRSIAEKK